MHSKPITQLPSYLGVGTPLPLQNSGSGAFQIGQGSHAQPVWQIPAASYCGTTFAFLPQKSAGGSIS